MQRCSLVLNMLDMIAAASKNKQFSCESTRQPWVHCRRAHQLFFFFEDLLISIQQFVRISSLHKQVTVEKGGADLFGCEGEIKVTIFLLEIHKTFQKGSNEARPTQKL